MVDRWTLGQRSRQWWPASRVWRGAGRGAGGEHAPPKSLDGVVETFSRKLVQGWVSVPADSRRCGST